MCHQLNMEDSIDDIVHQLGANDHRRVSFVDFARCRRGLLSEIEREKRRSLQEASLQRGPWQDDCVAPVSLFQLMEDHDPDALRQMLHYAQQTSGLKDKPNFAELANTLHLSALTSIKRNNLELMSHLQRISADKNMLDIKLTTWQCEQHRIESNTFENSQEATSHYEDRIVELHSVIAELRAKLDRCQIHVIREVDEESCDSNRSNHSNNMSLDATFRRSITDLKAELNADFNSDVGTFETDIDGMKPSTEKMVPPVKDDYNTCVSNNSLGSNQSSLVEHNATGSCETENKLSPPPLTSPVYTTPTLQHKNSPLSPTRPINVTLSTINPSEHDSAMKLALPQNKCIHLRDLTHSLETDLKPVRTQNNSLREERDYLKQRVRELQCLEMISSPHHSRTSTPTKIPQTLPNGMIYVERAFSGSESDQGSNGLVTKVAELKRLKTSVNDGPLPGAHTSYIGLPTAKVAEHLTQTLQEQCDIQEIVNASSQNSNINSDDPELTSSRVHEFEIEFERLTSKIDNIRSQNEVLTLTLEESKAYSDRLTILIGRYESNHVASKIALELVDQALKCSEVLTELLDTDRDLLMINCKAVGIGSLGAMTTAGDSGMEGDEQDHSVKLSQTLQTTHSKRKQAEHLAKLLIQKNGELLPIEGCYPPRAHLDCDDLTQVTSALSSTGSSVDTEFTRLDERRLRESIEELKHQRRSVAQTITSLESVNTISDHFNYPQGPLTPDVQRLDLENAILMQELMAIKEEKAELRSHNYVLEKEKRGLELQVHVKRSQERVYTAPIEHFRAELQKVGKGERHQEEWRAESNHEQLCEESNQDDQQQTVQLPDEHVRLDNHLSTPSITLAELRANNSTEVSQDLAAALKRERKLKSRVQELVLALEKLSHNSEVSHQQSAQFVSDLKHANTALVTAFEKAKHKYQSRVKKMEAQMTSMARRYESQIRELKLHHQPKRSETSL